MTKNSIKLLVIDEDQTYLENVKASLANEFYLRTEKSAKESLVLLKSFVPDVVLLSCELRDTSYFEFLKELNKINSYILKLVTSKDFKNIEDVVDSINSGHIHYYFRRPLNYQALKKIIYNKFKSYGGQYAYAAQAEGGSYNYDNYIFSPEEYNSAYKKLATIIDTAKEAEKIKHEAEIQLASVDDIKNDCINQIKKVVSEGKKFKDEVLNLKSTIEDLKNKDEERIQFKKQLDELNQEKDILDRSYQNIQTKLNDQAKITAEEKKKLQNEVDKFKENYKETLKQKEDLKNILDEIESSINSSTVNEPILNISKEQQDVEGKKSILIVDDENEIRQAISNNLSTSYTVYSAESADKGLEEFKNHPDIGVIISDHKMPRKSGLEFAEEVRRIDSFVPILLLTGHQEHEKVIAAMNAGFINKYFQKPYPSKKLKEEAESAMDSYRNRLTEKTIVKGSAGSLDRIKNLCANLENLKLINNTLKDQNKEFEEKTQKMLNSTNELKNKIMELETSVPKEREKMQAQMKVTLENFERDMKEKSERMLANLEEQKNILTEENRKEVERINGELKAEKERAQKEQEQFKKEMENMQRDFEEKKSKQQQQLKDEREKMIKDAEAEVKKLQDEMNTMKINLEQAFKKEMEEKKKFIEQELVKLEEQKKKAENDIVQIKAAATFELDQLKADVARKEQEVNNQLAKSKRIVQESEEQINLLKKQNKELADEFTKIMYEREKLLKECKEIQTTLDLTTQSREAIQDELAQLKAAR
ncbi:MAG: response regulator [Oligoflexia bacterium]|nr:response regulator [Oligoflexia bacterium]